MRRTTRCGRAGMAYPQDIAQAKANYSDLYLTVFREEMKTKKSISAARLDLIIFPTAR